MCIEDKIDLLEQQVKQLQTQLAKLEAQRNDKYVTPKQLAEIMNCSVNNIYVKIRSGEILADRSTGLPRIPMSQFVGQASEVAETPPKPKKKNEQPKTMKEMVFG